MFVSTQVVKFLFHFPLEADQTEFIINSPSVCMNSIAQDKQKELVFTGQRLASLSREVPSSA